MFRENPEDVTSSAGPLLQASNASCSVSVWFCVAFVISSVHVFALRELY